MTLPRIIIDVVFPSDNRAIMANKIVSWSTSVRQPSDSPLAVSRSPISNRSPRRTIARSSRDRPPRSGNKPAVLADNAASLTFALVQVHRTLAACCARRSKKLPRNAIKTRIDMACLAAAFAHRERRAYRLQIESRSARLRQRRT